MIEFVADNIANMFVNVETQELNVESLNTEIINIFGIDMLDIIRQNKNNTDVITENLKKKAIEIYTEKEQELAQKK